MRLILKQHTLLILLPLNLVSLPDSYEEKRVFVGADLDMRCVGPPTSTTLIYIKWGITSGANDTPIFVCLPVTGRSCNDTHGPSLDVQNSYTSSFTIMNVSLDDAREYVCTITTLTEEKLCRFNVTIKGAYTMYYKQMSFFPSVLPCVLLKHVAFNRRPLNDNKHIRLLTYCCQNYGVGVPTVSPPPDESSVLIEYFTLSR